MAIPHWMNPEDVLWRVDGPRREGVVITKRATHASGNRFGGRVVAVRDTEVDIKVFQGGLWPTFTVAKSLGPGVVPNDAVVLVMASGDGIQSYVVGSVEESTFASAADAASSTGVGVVR